MANMKKTIAAVMAFAMVFVAGVVVIGGEDSSIDAVTDENIKYFSGTLDGENVVPSGTIAYIDKDTKIIDGTAGAKGSIIVREGGYLKINSDVTLTIENASTGTVSASSKVISSSGGKLGGLVIEEGAYVVIEGTVVVKQGGAIINNAVTATSGTDVQGIYAGLTVNGSITVEKGGALTSKTTEGQMVISKDASVTLKSTNAYSSTLAGQTFKIAAGGSLSMDTIVSGSTYVESYSADGFGITSKVRIADISTIENDYSSTYSYMFPSTALTSGAVKLTFAVNAEKAGKLWNTTTGEATTKYSYLNLDVSGSVNEGAAFITMNSYTSNLTFLSSTGGNSGYKVYGLTEVSDALKITKNAALFTIGLSNLLVSGTLDVDAVKGSPANVYLAGNHFITGEVNVGDISLPTWSGSVFARPTADPIVVFGIHEDAYFNVTGDGIVNLDGYTIDTTNYKNIPGGTLGVYYTDEDGVFHIVSDIQKAIDVAIENNIDELTVSSYSDYGVYLKATQMIVSSDIVIPNDFEVFIYGTVSVSKDASLIVEDGADITSTNGQGGLISVSGYFYDYNITNYSYATAVPDNGTVKVKAEVKSVDADETYALYTSMKNALADSVEGTVITLFGNLSVSENMTIPTGVTVKTDNKTISISKEKELTVDGILEIGSTGSVYLLYKSGEESQTIAKLTVNNIIVDNSTSRIYKGTEASGSTAVSIPGIYAQGDIGDYDGKYFILSPAIAADNSSTLNSMVINEKTTYTGDLTFTATDDSSSATIDIKAESVFGKIVLDGYKITNDSGASSSSNKLTATIVADVTAGTAVVKLDAVTTDKLEIYISEDDSGDSIVTKLMVKTDSGSKVLGGALTIAEGTVYLDGELQVGTFTSSAVKAPLKISSEAELVVPNGSTLKVLKNTSVAAGVSDFVGLTVDGKLTINKGTLSTDANADTPSCILITGELDISGANQALSGKVFIKGAVTVATEGTSKAKLTLNNTVIVGEKPETLGASASIAGYVDLVSTTSFTVYPGSDLSAALINYDNNTGTSGAYSLDYIVDGEIIMTTYTINGTSSVTIANTMNVVGFNTIAANDWYVDAGFTTQVNGSGFTFQECSAIYAKVTPADAYVKISVGTGISAWIDGVKYLSGSVFKLTVGEHNIEVTIDPGYKGTTKVTFDGIQITNGKMIVTPEMSIIASDESDAPIILSVNGDITIDSGDTPTPTPTPVEPTAKDDSMGITEYLLIVLVVLAAILVVVVAIRMMRS